MRKFFFFGVIELSQCFSNQVRVQFNSVWVLVLLFSLFWILVRSCFPIVCNFPARIRLITLFAIFVGCLVFLFFPIQLVVDLFRMESLVVVHNLDQQINVLKLINAQTLPDGIDFNLELHFKTLADAFLLSLVVNQVISFFNQQLKHIFNLFVLVTDIDSISSLHRLVINQLTLALTLVLAVHN